MKLAKRESLAKYILMMALLFSLACTKQEAPKLSDPIGDVRSVERDRSCSQVNYLNGLLEHGNVVSLFNCLAWDKQFAHLGKAISSINANDWNHLMLPLDSIFFSNRERRDRIFSLLKDLDSKEALDQLLQVVTALNDTNVFDQLSLVLKCATNPDSVDCINADYKLSNAEVFRLLDLFDYEPSTVDNITTIVDGLIATLVPVESKFIQFSKLVINNDDFKHWRVALVTSLAYATIKDGGVSQSELDYLINLLQSKLNNKPYLFSWINSDFTTLDEFKHILQFPLLRNETLVKRFKVLNTLLDEELICNNNDVPGNSFGVNFGNVLDVNLDYLVNNNFSQFIGNIVESQLLVASLNKICDNLAVHNKEISIYSILDQELQEEKIFHSLDVKHFLIDYNNFVKRKPAYELARFVTSEASKTVGSRYLVKMMSSSALEVILKFTEVVSSISSDLFDLTYSLAKGIPPETYIASSSLIDKSKFNLDVLLSISKVWMFFSFEQRNFLFNFLDRHVQDDAKMVELLRFYQQMLNEFKYLSRQFVDAYALNESQKAKSVSAFQNIFSAMSGESVLKDFTLFFSRDHVLKTISILTRGVEFKELTYSTLVGTDLSNYYADLGIRNYSISSSNQSTEHVLNCLESLTNQALDLNSLAYDLNQPCKEGSIPSIMIDSFKGLNYASKNFVPYFNYELMHESKEHNSHHFLFDYDGIFSQKIISNLLASLKKTDDILQQKYNKSLNSIIDFGYEYFNKQNKNTSLPSGCINCNSLLSSLDKVVILMGELAIKRRSYWSHKRSDILRKLLSQKLEPSLEYLIDNISSTTLDYGQWWKSDSGIQIRPHLPYNDCSNVLRRDIGIDPCPDTEVLQQSFDTIVNLFLRNNNKNENALYYFLRAIDPNTGLKIPFDRKDQENYYLSISELLKLAYETVDQSFMTADGILINKVKNPYQNVDEKDPVDREMTTAQRIEVVVRDIRFDNNFLGAHFMNAVSRAEDYDKVVNKKYKLLKFCALSLRTCGIFFNKDERRLVKNAITAYPSLLDISKHFGYGKFMKTLLQIVVASSSNVSGKASIIRIGDSDIPFIPFKSALNKHNGKILTELSFLSLFTNLGRVTHDRFGREGKAEFYKYLNSNEVKRISDYFLNNTSPLVMNQLMTKMLMTNNLVVDQAGKKLSDHLIEFIYSLNYQDQQIFENLVGNVLYVLSYLGNESSVGFNFQLSEGANARYAKNSVETIFEILNTVFKAWPKFNGLIDKTDALESMKAINNIFRFVRSKLDSNNVLSKRKYYQLLNEMFFLTNELVIEKGQIKFRKTILEKLVDYVRENDGAEKLIDATASMYNSIDALHYDGNAKSDKFFTGLSEYLDAFNLGLTSSEPFKDYVRLTVDPYIIRSAASQVGESNYHFDEIAGVVNFLATKDKEVSNFSKLVEFIFFDRREDYRKFLDSLTREVVIRKL